MCLVNCSFYYYYYSDPLSSGPYLLLQVNLLPNIPMLCILLSHQYHTVWFYMLCAVLSKNTGVDCHAVLQGIFPTQGSKPGLLHCRQILYHLSHQGSPGFHILMPFTYYFQYLKYCISLVCLGNSISFCLSTSISCVISSYSISESVRLLCFLCVLHLRSASILAFLSLMMSYSILLWLLTCLQVLSCVLFISVPFR